MAASPDSTAITAPATSQPAGRHDGQHRERHGLDGVNAELVCETCQHSRPHAIPAGTPITRAIPYSVSACQPAAPALAVNAYRLSAGGSTG